ncbi:MAG: oligoendopeptidase F [Anaerofustis stercorihominis]|nr:oligoendopeptidase F [Anaerofustis stercorihominis]
MRLRSEMNPEFMWDLAHIFKNDAEMKAQYEECEELIGKLGGYVGKLNTDKHTFRTALELLFDVNEKTEKVYIYAMLHKSADSSDEYAQNIDSDATNLYVKLQMAVSQLITEITELDDEIMDEYMQGDDMKTYAHVIEDIRRSREHTLDAQRELLLAKLSDFAQTPSNAFHMFNDSDIEFPAVKDENGEDAVLTNGNFAVYRQSKSRDVRENAFNTFFGVYKKYINTLASLYGGNIKYDNFIADIKNYDSAVHAALFGNNVPVSVYESLIQAMHDALPYMRDYLELRKKALGLDDIDMFDLYVPMIEDVEFDMNFDEAKAFVKKALEPLGERYGKLLDEAYTNRWMDVYENKGKRTGAFSCGVYGVHPYVLLNHTDTLNDAYTIAHELGHAMHSYLSDEAQDYVNHDYSILVAEVASTVNEVLMTLYLLETETDKKRRAYILNQFLESFRTTVFRQTLFAEFELIAHKNAQDGLPLTSHSLSDIYYSLISKYYQGIGIPDIMRYEWAYIPHFYSSFYVYQYATGFCSAVAIAKHIKETGDTSGYMKFLSLGGSVYPLDALKVAGVDLTKPDAVANAMQLFKETIDELAKLI